jgi:hypothetical protein
MWSMKLRRIVLYRTMLRNDVFEDLEAGACCMSSKPHCGPPIRPAAGHILRLTGKSKCMRDRRPNEKSLTLSKTTLAFDMTVVGHDM